MSKIVKTIYSYGNKIQLSEDGSVFINREETEFSSLEEARTYIKNKNISSDLETEITRELYEEFPETRIANIIREYHDVKVTDTLIESYIELASSNIFTLDPIVHEIRKLNKLDTLIEGKYHYELEDGSIVAIEEDTRSQLNNLFAEHKDIIEYMRKSKENFLYVVEKIKE